MSLSSVWYLLLLPGVTESLLPSGLAGGSGEYGPGDREAGLEMEYSL